jgi:hexokinase
MRSARVRKRARLRSACPRRFPGRGFLTAYGLEFRARNRYNKQNMKSIARSVDDFLSRARMDYRSVDARKFCADFIKEMERGLAGERSSLGMIPTYIETEGALPAGRRVIALDAGGTNLRVALVSFDAAGSPVIEGLARHRMPGSDGEIDRAEFFRSLAGFVAPLAEKADRIGFCFSYPAEMEPDKDGKLVFFSKEVKARGVEGQPIGANLARAMKEGGARGPARVILLNDTVATLLAGRNAMPGRRFDGYIGFVCGTGLNAAYVEPNANIGKKPELDPSGSQIINTELGGFDRGPAGEIDLEFNAATENPGRYRNEKMISGAYLGGLCLAAVARACRDGVLSAAAAKAAEAMKPFSTRDLGMFLINPAGDNPAAAACAELPERDAQGVYLIMDSIVERAALLVAMNLSAVLLKTGKGRDPRFPVCITVDGTTFWQLKDFRTRMECHMRSFLAGDDQRAYQIAAAGDAPLVGAAIAALTNS